MTDDDNLLVDNSPEALPSAPCDSVMTETDGTLRAAKPSYNGSLN